MKLSNKSRELLDIRLYKTHGALFMSSGDGGQSYWRRWRAKLLEAMEGKAIGGGDVDFQQKGESVRLPSVLQREWTEIHKYKD